GWAESSRPTNTRWRLAPEGGPRRLGHLRIIRPRDHPKVWPANRPRRFPIGEFHRPPLAFRATSGAEGKTHWRSSWTIVKIGADMEGSHLHESAPAINSSGREVFARPYRPLRAQARE